jgi:hypothetical protein
MQHSFSNSKVASFLEVRCNALLLDSSMFALCNHPTADVLSPSARMQEKGGVELHNSSSQIVVTTARNSNRLFFE